MELVAGSQSGYCNNQQLWALLKATIALNELLAFSRAQECLKTRPEGESSSWFFLRYTSLKQHFSINCSKGLFKCQSEPMYFSITSDNRLYTNSNICNYKRKKKHGYIAGAIADVLCVVSVAHLSQAEGFPISGSPSGLFLFPQKSVLRLVCPGLRV